jgi:hypothetical protein
MSAYYVLEAKRRQGRRYIWETINRFQTREDAERVADQLKNPTYPEVLRVREDAA